MTLAAAVLALVTIERLCELALSRRNATRLAAAGAVEHGREHYSAIVALHVAWLAGLWLLARERPVDLAWLGVYLAFEVLRAWVMATLDRRWTTRIIVLPGAPLVRSLLRGSTPPQMWGAVNRCMQARWTPRPNSPLTVHSNFHPDTSDQAPRIIREQNS